MCTVSIHSWNSLIISLCNKHNIFIITSYYKLTEYFFFPLALSCCVISSKSLVFSWAGDVFNPSGADPGEVTVSWTQGGLGSPRAGHTWHFNSCGCCQSGSWSDGDVDVSVWAIEENTPFSPLYQSHGTGSAQGGAAFPQLSAGRAALEARASWRSFRSLGARVSLPRWLCPGRSPGGHWSLCRTAFPTHRALLKDPLPPAYTV